MRKVCSLRRENEPMMEPFENPEPEKPGVAVRPDFAVVVFGLPAFIIFLVTVVQSATLLEYLAGFSWSGSLLLVAIRGYLNEEKDAFAPIRNVNANAMPIVFAVVATVAFLESENTPGIFLAVLAFGWTLAAPAWQRMWESKPARMIGDLFSLVQAIAMIALIGYLVWSWLSP